MGFYLDAADTFWQEWVLNYNLDRQLILAAQMEDSSRMLGSRWLDRVKATVTRWKTAAAAWAGQYGVAALIVALLAAIAWRYFPRLRAWWRTLARVRQVQRGAARASDATLLYARMLVVLQRRGFQKPAWVTPAEFARLLPVSETATLVARFTAAYNELRFGGDCGAAPRMMQLLQSLEHQ
jgi:hypothetical protein